MRNAGRWRGLVALVRDAVEHGSRAVEKVQLETAGRPFGLLEQIPAVAEPTRVVHVIHDATVSGVHGVIRAVSRAVGATADVVLRVAEEKDRQDAGAPKDG
jgi:hypothetical protein